MNAVRPTICTWQGRAGRPASAGTTDSKNGYSSKEHDWPRLAGKGDLEAQRGQTVSLDLSCPLQAIVKSETLS